jgi:outer membrane autotransporter protein
VSNHRSTRLDLTKILYHSTYGGRTVAANLRTGRYVKLHKGIELKPYVVVQGSTTRTNDHKEERIDGFEMGVETNTANSLNGGFGMSVAMPQVINDNWRAIPQASATYTHEFINPVRTVSATWVGENLLIQTPALSRETVALTAGLEAKSRGGTSVSLEYAASLKNKFVSHAGSLRMAYKFKPEAFKSLFGAPATPTAPTVTLEDAELMQGR